MKDNLKSNNKKEVKKDVNILEELTLEQRLERLEKELERTRQEIEFVKKIKQADADARKEWEAKHNKK